MADQISVRCSAELRRRVLRDADSRSPRITISEVVVRILADYYGEPSLAEIPRKLMGRPRKVPA